MKRLTSLATLLILFVCAVAQQFQPLPLIPGVKSGKLDNGLTYYIMHNEQPKERANFYIAQKVGSALETPDQLGLAHFLEHMAFNGTTHYPGKDMLNYLQSKGIRFGADINAYTYYDETVYNIDNVITTDKPLMDSVLLVIRDWCDGILLEDSEIEAERGVINEEWRQRNSAQWRQMNAVLPKVFKEYQYQQSVIGTMDVVMNFKPETLRAYYKKWYRPDQQGIVIVGDFDADEMEKKVKELFSTVKMPENAAPREYVEISDNKEPIYVHFEDPELQSTVITTYFKSDKTPWEMRNTQEGYMMDVLVTEILTSMINDRLAEYATNPECPYMQAFVMNGDFMQVAATKDAFTIYVVPKGDVIEGYKSAMGIIARACKAGFTQSELERANTELINSFEKSYNERDKTYNASYGQELIQKFIKNTPAPGIETELMLAKGILPQLPVDIYNQVAQQILTPENQVIIVSQPLNDATKILEEAEIVGALESTINAKYEAYVDEVITDPLIEKLPKPGKVKTSKANANMGTTEFTLSNGVKVVLKTTDFKADEIQMQAYRMGGKQQYTEAQAPNVQMLEDAVQLSKLGKFDINTMKKYLAGKTVSLGYKLGTYTDYLEGYSSVKDLNTLMECVYAYFTALNPDEEKYDATVAQIEVALANFDKMPQRIFAKEVAKARYGNKALMNQIDLPMVKAANYNEMLKMAKASMANAADYTFVFTGNVDEATLRPLLEQYIATLPSKGKADKAKTVTNLSSVDGIVVNKFDMPMQAPVTNVFNMYSGYNIPYSMENYIMADLVGDVLQIIYTETLREDEGGTYGAGVGSSYNFMNGQWALMYQYNTAEEKMENLDKRAIKELKELIDNGAKAEHFNNVKEAAIKQYEINSKTNSYWMGQITNDCKGHNTYNGYIETLQDLTLDKFNAFLKNIILDKNHIEVVMVGKQAAE